MWLLILITYFSKIHIWYICSILVILKLLTQYCKIVQKITILFFKIEVIYKKNSIILLLYILHDP